ncbi:MAG: hypothetical protein ABI995_13005, partial [Acidobacteriota bacterium]
MRNDVVRGIRWAGMLLVAGLLLVAAFRVIQLSPAEAKPPAPSAASETQPPILEVAPVAVETVPSADDQPKPPAERRPKAPKVEGASTPMPVSIPLSAPKSEAK